MARNWRALYILGDSSHNDPLQNKEYVSRLETIPFKPYL